MNDSSKFSLSQTEKNFINSILKKLEDEKEKKDFRTITFHNLFNLLNKDEKDLINRLLKIDLLEFGFNGKYYGIQDVPNNLVEIANQEYTINSERKIIDIQYLPKEVFSAYTELNKSLYNDRKSKLMVLSGYRSPACQMFVFIWYLKFYKFDLSKTIKRAAIPGYSEHGFPKRQAIDFMTENGQPSEDNPSDFEKTVEYQWLKENAGKFSFYETNRQIINLELCMSLGIGRT